MPDPTDSPESNRSLAVLAIGAGLVASATLVARSATVRGPVADAVANSALGQFIVVAVCGLLVGRSFRNGRPSMRSPELLVLVGASGLGAVWGAILGRNPVDPNHLGLIGPPGSATFLVLTIALVTFIWATAIGSDRIMVPARVSALLGSPLPGGGSPGAGVLLAVSLVSLVASGMQETLGLFVGGAVSLLVPLLRFDSTGERTLPTTSQMIGAAAGLVVAAPATFHFIAEHNVERVTNIEGATRLTGALVTPWLWTVLVAASVGIVGAWVVELGLAVRRRSLRFSMGSFLVSLVATTFLLRIATLVNIVTARRNSGDPFFYHVTANLLAQGRGFNEPVQWVAYGINDPSAVHGPAFSVALSFWSRLGGTSYIDHQLASIVLGLPQVVFGVLLAQHLAGRRAAIAAAFLLVIYPNIWITDGTLFVEGMMAGLTTAATWALYRWRDHPSIGRMVGIGTLIGLAALTRGEAVLLVGLLVPVVFFWGDLDRRQRVMHAAAGVLACVVTLVPWTIYNSTRFETAVPLSTNSNEVLFYANCEDSYYGPLLGYWSYACQTRHRDEFGDPGGDQSEQAVYWREQAIDYISAHKSRVPVVVAARVARQWDLLRPNQNTKLGDFVEGRPRPALLVGLGMFYAMMALSVAASFAMRRKRMPIWPMWSHAVAVTLTAIYAYGTLRFRAPFEPILCVLAAVGAVALWDRFRQVPPAIEETA